MQAAGKAYGIRIVTWHAASRLCFFFIFKMNSIMREIANATFALLLVGLGIRLKFCLSVNGLIGGAC